MADIDVVFARIDNRLVHGQVGMVWSKTSGANIIVVVDDDTVNDPMQQQLMKMTIATNSIAIRFWSVENTIKNIWKASPTQKIFIITRTPKVMRTLVDAGIPIKAVNIGNMHTSPGKRQFKNAYIYVDDEDLADFEAMKAKGVKLTIQVMPEYKAVEVD